MCPRLSSAPRTCARPSRTFSREKHLITERSARPSRPSSPRNRCARRALEECRRQGGIFCLPEEMRKSRRAGISCRDRTRRIRKLWAAPRRVIAGTGGHPGAAGDASVDRAARSGTVGREFPLSAEKLSPILAFYAVPNLAAGIDALHAGCWNSAGWGTPARFIRRIDAAILEFGEAVPAFRVCVNSCRRCTARSAIRRICFRR